MKPQPAADMRGANVSWAGWMAFLGGFRIGVRVRASGGRWHEMREIVSGPPRQTAKSASLKLARLTP
jgi:hypothetical protein